VDLKIIYFMVKENKEQTKIVIVFKECIKMVKKDTVL
jgi:hypothetical protein